MEIIEILWKVPPGERVVGIVQWRDVVIVATDGGVYRVAEDGTYVHRIAAPR